MSLDLESRIRYSDITLKPWVKKTIAHAVKIIAGYIAEGFGAPTARQLYYQFVQANLIRNNHREYKKLLEALQTGRMMGLIGWESIVDITRYLRGDSHFDNPGNVLEAATASYKLNHWADQQNYIELYVEKDAMIGVVDAVCRRWDIDYLACRGYASASEIWRAGHYRFRRAHQQGKTCHVLYFGDHDPSGIDMTRDLRERLNLFARGPSWSEDYDPSIDPVQVHRIALNIDQVKKFKLPPNPTKITDSRSKEYIKEFGNDCWELDALRPLQIVGMIDEKMKTLVDRKVWDAVEKRQETERKQLKLLEQRLKDGDQTLFQAPKKKPAKRKPRKAKPKKKPKPKKAKAKKHARKKPKR